MAGLTQGTRFGLRALDRQATRAVTAGDLEAVDRVLRGLVEAMEPGNSREPPLVEGSRTVLHTVTDLGGAAAALGDELAEVRLLVEGERLVLQWVPARHVTSLASPPPPRRAVLLEEVAGLDLSYWGPMDGSSAPGWRGDWDRQALPALVRFRLVFPEGSGRRWPDIVAATRRERNGG